MQYLASFLFLIFSPGLRGIPFIYYPLLLASLVFSCLSIPTSNHNIFSLRALYSIQILLVLLIYVLVVLSLVFLDDRVLLPELLISLARFSLPIFFVSFFFLFPRIVFFRSLYVATFFSLLLSALSLYAQGLLGVPFDFLSASAHERALLARYASTMGSLTAASLGIPLGCFSLYCMNLLIPCRFTPDLPVIRRISLVPHTVYVPFFLFSLVFTLSRTALISSFILLFVLYVLPCLPGFFSFKFKLSAVYRLRTALVYLFTLFLSVIFIYKFRQSFNVLAAFLDSSRSSALRNDGVASLFDDIVERLFWFDPGAFDLPRLLFGGGYHHVSGSLGIVSAGRFSHNTFIDLFHIFGIFGPFLLGIFFLVPLFIGLKHMFSSEPRHFHVSSLNLGFFLIMLPNYLTFSGAIYVPLFMTPIFALYLSNESFLRNT